MQKKFMAWLLTLCLVLSLVPVSLSANTTVEENALEAGDVIALDDADKWTGAEYNENTYAEVWVRGDGWGTGTSGSQVHGIALYKIDGTGPASLNVNYTVEVELRQINVEDAKYHLTDYKVNGDETTASAVAFRVNTHNNNTNGSTAKVITDSPAVYTHTFKLSSAGDWYFYIYPGNVDDTGTFTSATGYSPVGIGGIRIYETANPENIIYTWGRYAPEGENQWSDISRWDRQTVINGTPYYSANAADGTMSYAFDEEILPGVYKLSGNFWTDAGTLTLGDTTVTADKTPVEFTLTVEDGDSVDIDWTDVDGATALNFNDVTLEYVSPILALDNADNWTGAEYNGNTYAEVWVRGQGWGVGPDASQIRGIPLYTTSTNATPFNYNYTQLTPGVYYTLEVELRQINAEDAQYSLADYGQPKLTSTTANAVGFRISTGNAATVDSNSDGVYEIVSTVDARAITASPAVYTKNFKLGTNPGETWLYIYALNVDEEGNFTHSPDWSPMGFGGIKIYETANPENVAFAWGRYAPEGETQWSDISRWGRQTVINGTPYYSANAADGKVTYTFDETLLPGVYKLSGNFWTDAGSVSLDAAIGDIAAKGDSVEITQERTPAEFSFTIEEETLLSEIILSWTKADDTSATELRFTNLMFAPVEAMDFGECGDNLEWTLLDDGTLVISGTGAMWNWESDAAPWAEYQDSITALTIEEGVTTIGNGAFSYLEGIEGNVILPSTLTQIGDEAFMYCSGITGIPTIPSDITYIGASAFLGCSEIGGVLTIPESVAEIGDGAFYGCSALEGVTFETRTAVFGSDVFAQTNDALVIYGYANSTAEAYANENGHAFTALREALYYGYCGTNAKWEVWSDGVLAISGTGAMKNYTDGTDTPWYAYRDMITSITVESGVTAIGNCAFRYLGNVETATLPDTLKSIGKYAFDYAEKLESVNIPSRVTSIGDSAFGFCRALTEIVLPDSATTLGDYLFYKCTSLETAKLPSDITAINDSMFENCYSLKYISWERGITTIGEAAFAGCTSLNYVVIPESVTSIGAGAFRECEWLYTMMIPESVTEIGVGAFDFCPNVIVFGYEDSAAEAYANANGHNFSIIEIPVIAEGEFGNGLAWTIYENGKLNISGQGAIPDYTVDSPSPWYEYRRHFNTVVIDAGITSIGDYAFFSCIGIDNVFIPSTVKSIGDWAFTYCSEITAIALPNSINAIGEGAFYGCVALGRIVIPEGVTAIEDFAFDGCTALEHVTFPSTLRTIGTRAFWGCTALTELVFNNGLTEIGDYAFRNCVGLVEIEIPGTVKKIGTHAFADLHFVEIVKVLSRDAEFSDNVFIYSPNVVVYGYAGSTAQTYASAKKHAFVVMKQGSTDITDAITSSMVVPTTATVTAPAGGFIEGENTFTVACDKVCRVFVSNDGGATYERLIATANANGGYDFTAELNADSKIVVRIFGDMNGNGELAPNDVVLLKRIIKGTYDADDIANVLADVNGNGELAPNDVVMLKRIIKGTYTGYTW